MHIPTVQSLFCLSLLAAPYASALPLDEDLQPRAATTCNASNVKTLKNANKQPVTYCKSWLASKHSKSTVKGLTVAQVSNACKCVQASASSSSAAAAKKTSTAQKKVATAKKVVVSTKKSSSTKKATTSTKKSSSAKKATTSTRKTTSSKKATTSAKKVTTSAKKATTISKKVTTSKKVSTSTKRSTSSKKPTTSSKASTSQKSTARTSSTSKKTTTTRHDSSPYSSKATYSATAISTSVTSEKSTWTPVSTQQSSSSSKAYSSTTSSKPTASSSSSTLTVISSSSTLSTISSSSLYSTSSTLSTISSSTAEASSNSLASSASSSPSSSAGNVLPTDATSNVQPSNGNIKAPNSVSTRSTTANAQTTSSPAASSQTSSASTGAKDATVGSGTNVLTNGNFNQGSFANWHGAHAIKTKFSVASLAGDSNYEALVNYSLDPNDNASGQIYQNVTIPAGMAWQLIADVFFNYPSSLPAGVSCVVKYSLGSDNIILKQYGAITSSGATVSDNASGQLSTAFTGRFQIDTYCNSVSSSATSFSLGFGNVQLLISTPSSTTSSIATSTSASATSSTCAPNVPTNTNLISNGDFSSGSLSSWNTGSSTVGSASYAVQARSGTSDNYAVMNLTPGSYNEANAQMSQKLQVIGGYSYSFSADVYFNLPSGLPSGAVCTITYQVGDTNIYGYETDRVTIDSNNHISDSYSGTVANTDCNASLQIYVDCSGISSPITVGFDNVQFRVQAASATSTLSPSSTTSSAASATSTKANLITNGDFGTGDYTGWALYRLGDATFAIEGNPNAYVSVMSFPAGGDANSQAGLMQQAVTVQAGKTYTLNMGLLLDYPSALPADGSTCSIQVYMVDSDGFGILFAQQSFSSGDAAFQTITGSGSANNGFDGQFDILLRCYGGAQTIVAGIEDVQVFMS